MSKNIPAVPFGVEPVTGNPPMTKDEIRDLVHRAGDAAERLEQMVRELVEVRAWEVLGYENFVAMWEGENGDKASSLVKVIVTLALADEGMNTRRAARVRDGHTQGEVAQMVGEGFLRRRNYAESPIVRSVLDQREAGVATKDIKFSANYHTVARAKNRLIGNSKGPHELVPTGINIYAWQKDAMSQTASDEDVPDTEIYRRAIDQFLAKLGKTPPRGLS